jgi:2-polyprenyl-3-methyl-5-hydroxy-6-metoxy-1,4-benzoquinol methylase
MIFNGLIQKGMSVIRRFLPTPCIHCLRSIFRFRNVSTNDCVDASQADLPYFATLKEFEEAGKILKRENIYGSGPPSPEVSQELLYYLTKYAGPRILDIGCGIGAYMKRLSSYGHECEGIETNQDYVSACLLDGLKVQLMSAQELQFSPNSFDTVIMIEVLEHLPEPIVALGEAFRVAKKNVLISVPNIDVLPIMSKYQIVPWHILEATHVNFFTPRILESALKIFAAKSEVFTYGHFASWISEKALHQHVFGVGWKDRPALPSKD